MVDLIVRYGISGHPVYIRILESGFTREYDYNTLETYYVNYSLKKKVTLERDEEVLAHCFVDEAFFMRVESK